MTAPRGLAVRNLDWPTPIAGTPNSTLCIRTQAGPTARVQVGGATGHEQVQFAQVRLGPRVEFAEPPFGGGGQVRPDDREVGEAAGRAPASA